MAILAAWFFEQFKEAIIEEDFEDLLKDAQADPKGVAAQDLLKKVLPFLNISGRQVPWGSVAHTSSLDTDLTRNTRTPHFTLRASLAVHVSPKGKPGAADR